MDSSLETCRTISRGYGVDPPTLTANQIYTYLLEGRPLRTCRRKNPYGQRKSDKQLDVELNTYDKRRKPNKASESQGNIISFMLFIFITYVTLIIMYT
jgi:hypothetical protein